MMKKGMFLITLLVILVFLVGCSPGEEVSDQDVDSALEELSEEELNELANLPEESGALAGNAKAILPNKLQAKINSHPKLKYVKSSVLKSKAQTILKKVENVPTVNVGSFAELDNNLKVAVREELGLSSSQEITSELALQLENLVVNGQDKQSWQKIKSLSGIEQFSNLKRLQLMNQEVSDLTSLSSLSFLENLHLENNGISDISAISNLRNLKYLNLKNNNINSINDLSLLTSLETVFLSRNQITTLTGLRHASNLKKLDISNNQISTLLVEWNIPQMTDLILRSNQIVTISVISHWNMGSLLNLDLRGNPLSSASCGMRTQLYGKFNPAAGLPAGFKTDC